MNVAARCATLLRLFSAKSKRTICFSQLSPFIMLTCPCNEHPLTPHLYIVKLVKVKPGYLQMTLFPRLGVAGISTSWSFRYPQPVKMIISIASSPRLSGTGMTSLNPWFLPLNCQMIVYLSSPLLWELGTNFPLVTAPGEGLSIWRFTSKLFRWCIQFFLFLL